MQANQPHYIKALLIDDEAMALDMLEYLIRKNIPAITTIKKVTNAREGLEMIQQFKPDLLFLDIQMPYLSGFDLLTHLKQWTFSVIFTTAYNKYAIKAIRFSALDYLLKPVDADELTQAVDRYLQRKTEQSHLDELYNNFVSNVGSEENKNYKLALSDNSGVRLVKPSEIIRCEAQNNYTQFYLTDRKMITTSKTLKEYEEILKDYGFLRVHKAHLINLAFVKEFNSQENVLVMNDGSAVEVSRRRKPEVMEALKKV